MDVFTKNYIEAAIWATGLDRENYDIDDLSPETLAEMVVDCTCFQRDHANDIAANPELAGHDFFLTRNRCGSGFWDGDWPYAIGRRLTQGAHAAGSFNLYVGDDGKIYHHS